MRFALLSLVTAAALAVSVGSAEAGPPMMMRGGFGPSVRVNPSISSSPFINRSMSPSRFGPSMGGFSGQRFAPNFNSGLFPRQMTPNSGMFSPRSSDPFAPMLFPRSSASFPPMLFPQR